MMSNLRNTVLALSLIACASQVQAQEMPGDDYVNVCNTTYTNTYTNRYGGLSSCSAYSASSGFVQLYEWVAPQLSNRRTIYGFAPMGGLLSCVANVPYYDTLTTSTPTTTCSMQPRQPFVALGYFADDCVETPGRVVGELYWNAQEGDRYEVQWRYKDQTQFNAHWYGEASGQPVYMPFEYLRSASTPLVYRLRAIRNGTAGSWSYVSPMCGLDRHER